jgi:hypothetical protein
MEPFEPNTGGPAIVMTNTGVEDAVSREDGILVEQPEHGEPGIYGPFASEDEAVAEARSVLGEARNRGVALTFLVMEFYGDGKWGYAMADVSGSRAHLYTKDETMASIRRSEIEAGQEGRT